jgi:sulfoxide reductase heme-binding subunit YedZ
VLALIQVEPLRYVWWLVSRASGIVALVLIAVTVVLGLAGAAGVLRGSRIRRPATRLHEQLALTALAAVALHGLALLGDHWLKPGWRGITIPFELSYRPAATGAGIIAGYLALLLGPSFYLRRRIGARRWRKLHRLTMIAWALSIAHALTAGSDAGRLWLRAVVLLPIPVVVYLLVLRIVGSAKTLDARPADLNALRALRDGSRRARTRDRDRSSAGG